MLYFSFELISFPVIIIVDDNCFEEKISYKIFKKI